MSSPHDPADPTYHPPDTPRPFPDVDRPLPDVDRPLPDDAATAAFCGHCGRELAEGGHESCRERLALEPPRYCGQCRRRMIVQVVPGSWSARCSVHGSIEHSTWG